MSYRVFLLLPLLVLLSRTASAQTFGGDGKGDASALSASPTALYSGGSGRGEKQASVTATSPATLWELMRNNRAVTWEMLAIATARGGVNVGTGTPPTTKRLITKAGLSTYQITANQPGMVQGTVAKANNQVIIRGDVRSIRIDVSAGQTQCSGTTFTQTLWLDVDGYVAGETRCYTDKTLQTVYTSGNGTSWYRIQSGGSVKIDANGYIVEVGTCQ